MVGHMANPATNFEDLTPIRSGVDLQRFFLVTIDAYAATAYAPNHVTSEEGVKSSYIVITLDLNLPVHCTTIKGRLLLSRPMFKKFLSPVEIEPEMAVLGKLGGLNVTYWFRNPQKALPCVEPRRLTYFASKSVRMSAVAFLKNPQK